MSRILLTGATGAFGSVLLADLTRAGHEVVCLVRDSGSERAADRLKRIAHERGAVIDRIKLIKGDVLDERYGVSVHHREFYRNCIDLLVHCAASISFDEKDRNRTFATNVTGVQEMLAMAEDMGIADIRHISTSYVAGDSVFATELDSNYKGQRWRNYYEESKFLGEGLVRAWVMSRPEERRFMIMRPSIIVGRFSDGWSPTFDAYYGFFRPLHAAAEFIREHVRQGKPLPPDVRVQADGQVHLPLVLHASRTSTLNLMPVDVCAKNTAALIGCPANNRVYHLVHPSPPRVVDVIRHSLAILGICGIRIAEDEVQQKAWCEAQSPRTAALQRSYCKALERYAPYTTHEAHFTVAHARAVLHEEYTEPDPVTPDVFAELLRYALRTEWGNKTEPAYV